MLIFKPPLEKIFIFYIFGPCTQTAHFVNETADGNRLEDWKVVKNVFDFAGDFSYQNVNNESSSKQIKGVIYSEVLESS